MTALTQSPTRNEPRIVRPSRLPVSSRRDSAVDVARAACLVVVVLLHATMVGVSSPGGVAVIENAMDSWSGFAAATWIVQVMPLFFVLGGFSSFTQWSSLRWRGVSAAEYVALRLRRLLVPAVAAIAATAAVLLALPTLGVSGDIAATAGFRLSQPLWFLGVYILCTAFVPVMAALHARSPRRTLGVLALLAVGVDVSRSTSGVDAIGFLNLLVVWLLVQQMGFFLADGSFGRLSGHRRFALGGGALAALVICCASGFYSVDLFGNLNPPTGALVLLGVVQLCVFAASRPLLRSLHSAAPVAAAVGWINARSLTIYAWHMLVLIGLAGALLVSGMPLPDPVSPDWWATRPVWLATVVLLVGATAWVFGRIETGSTRRGGETTSRRTVSWARVAVATLVAASGVLIVLVAGASPLAWLTATAAIGWVLSRGLAGALDRPAHEDGARRRVLDPLRGTAEEDRVAQTLATARDDDEIGLELLGGPDDLGGRGTAADLLHDRGTPAVEVRGHDVESSRGFGPEAQLDGGGPRLPPRSEFVRERDGGAWTHDRDDHHLVDLLRVGERAELPRRRE
ncbi:acyltransferase [Labedella phragmitis]|uniref:Acyltransferase n=1 Tax=Labedella phragmitis TaxID=2498849 RepID=A0A3S4ALZ6_9MICO|nr:acyltransferase [Labedella phragmitis]